MPKQLLEKLEMMVWNGLAAARGRRLKKALEQAYQEGRTAGWDAAVKEYITG